MTLLKVNFSSVIPVEVYISVLPLSAPIRNNQMKYTKK